MNTIKQINLYQNCEMREWRVCVSVNESVKVSGILNCAYINILVNMPK